MNLKYKIVLIQNILIAVSCFTFLYANSYSNNADRYGMALCKHAAVVLVSTMWQFDPIFQASISNGCAAPVGWYADGSLAPRKGVEPLKIEHRFPMVPLQRPHYKAINQKCNFQLKKDSTLNSDGWILIKWRPRLERRETDFGGLRVWLSGNGLIKISVFSAN